MEKVLRIGSWDVPSLDCLQKRFSRFYRFKEGAEPDPSTQFSLLCLYIFEHPTFHSAQDDEMHRGV